MAEIYEEIYGIMNFRQPNTIDNKEIKQLGALRSALKFSLPTLAGSAPVNTRAGQQAGLQFWLFGHIGHHRAKKRAAHRTINQPEEACRSVILNKKA
jgi:hypothetical protein